MNEYISSLKKLNDFSFDSIAPGHGNYIDNPYEIIEWTIQHRLDREEKVFKKLSKLEEDEDELKIKCEPDIGGDTGRYYKCS